jgi:hypothetical protein
MKMSGLTDLGGAKATLALVLSSIFLVSANPALAQIEEIIAKEVFKKVHPEGNTTVEEAARKMEEEQQRMRQEHEKSHAPNASPNRPASPTPQQ